LILQGDGDKLKRLFLNLLDNAIKYTPQSGRVEINITEEKEFAKISISDTGIEYQKKIFLIYLTAFIMLTNRAQIQDSAWVKHSKSIAEAHRGRIEAYSKSGHGSTFIVFLPLQR